jgi:hypothetical protein
VVVLKIVLERRKISKFVLLKSKKAIVIQQSDIVRLCRAGNQNSYTIAPYDELLLVAE